jgi:LPXTG-motif cell wall-anchored protein
LSEDGLTVINTYDIELDNKVPGGSGSGEDQENGDSLPKTGMVSSLSFYIPGMLLLVLGTLGMFYNRRKKVLDRK